MDALVDAKAYQHKQQVAHAQVQEAIQQAHMHPKIKGMT